MFTKKNVAVAAALALAGFAAQAQVVLYGNLDVSVGRKETTTITPAGVTNKTGSGRVDSGDLYETYLGFKGQEDLGGGLKGFFKLENGLNLDTGATGAQASGTTFWNRNAYVGVGGDFGAIKLGRTENLFKLEAVAFNPFGESASYSPLFRPNAISAQIDQFVAAQAGVPANVAAAVRIVPLLGVDNTSWANSVTYSTPNLSGFKLAVQGSLAENQKSSDTLGAYAGGGAAVSARYDAGPLGLSAVYGETRSTDGANGVNVVNGPLVKSRDWLVGASYDFTAVKLYGQYGQSKLKAKNAVLDDLLDDNKIKRFQVGVGIPVASEGTVLVSYGESKLDSDNAIDLKARDLSLGYVHNVSKRTGVYGAVGAERLNLNDDKTTATNVSIGVRHTF